MRRVACILGITAIGCIPVPASAQKRPDFAGRWTSEPPPTAPARRETIPGNAPTPGSMRATPKGEMGSGWGPTITIKQDANTLTVEYAFFSRYDMQPPLRFVYALDGSETTNTVALGRGVQAQTSRAAWKAEALVIATTLPFPHPDDGRPMTSEVTRTLSLESPASLVVETVIGGVLGGPPTATRTVYRRL